MPQTTPDLHDGNGPTADGPTQRDERAAPVATEEGHTPYLPPPAAGRDEAIDKDLLLAWKDYMKKGFQQNNMMFSRVLRAFMVPYWLTVAMNVALFLFGWAPSAWRRILRPSQNSNSAIFGGLSAATFLTFFISRPLRSLEQNVILITWLGVIYNTYWSQLMNITNPATVQQDLDSITKAAVKDLRALATAQGKLNSQRPDLPDTQVPQSPDSS